MSGYLLGENARAKILVASSLGKKKRKSKESGDEGEGKAETDFFVYLSPVLDLIFAI